MHSSAFSALLRTGRCERSQVEEIPQLKQLQKIRVAVIGVVLCPDIPNPVVQSLQFPYCLAHIVVVPMHAYFPLHHVFHLFLDRTAGDAGLLVGEDLDP
jgi:hypothetical protein